MTQRHALRESQFRRYEPLIEQIVTAWPKSSFFTPEAPIKSAETLRARLRDAMLSFYQNRWSSKIPFNDFAPIFEESKVVINDQKQVVVCLRTNPLTPCAVPVKPGLSVTTENIDIVMALLVLHHASILLTPTQLHTALPLQNMINAYDVHIAETSDGYTIL